MSLFKYTYKHKDGRTASSIEGCWKALWDTLGQEEASRLLDEQDPWEWVDLSKIDRADFSVKGIWMGEFTKEAI